MSFTINANNHNIQLTRGDSVSFNLLDDATGLEMVFESTDRIKLTVRAKANSINTLIEKEFSPDVDGHILIVIAPSDTATLDLATGVYDIQWTQDADNVFTLIPASGSTARLPTFQICPEVSYDAEVPT
jgi:hypothetical protein